jgi:hypothetical protein
MKKLLVVLLISLFLLGSFPMAFAEEAHEHDGCCETHANGGGIVPLVDCDHPAVTYGTHHTGIQRGCYVMDYYDKVCLNCREIIGTMMVNYELDHHLGNPYNVMEDGVPVIYCDYCRDPWYQD